MEHKRSDNSLQDIIGESPALKQTLRLAMKAARSAAPLLILGEAGSGRELIARAVHRISVRRNESFVKVNCAAARDGMLGSEIFGHAKETDGKSQEIGQFELANIRNAVLGRDLPHSSGASGQAASVAGAPGI
jgi:transcriptional regulator with GAF, ATPase, and Fis domain